jgi:hypothetical protein
VCAETIAFYERVSTAAFMTRTPVPPELVAMAKAVFRPEKRREAPVQRMSARRIMPSSNTWALAGIRSAMQSRVAKHAVYECGDFWVDPRSEVQPDTVRISLVGQLANQVEPQREFGSVPVRLVAGKKIV